MAQFCYDSKRSYAMQACVREVIQTSYDPVFATYTFWSDQGCEFSARHWQIFLGNLRRHFDKLLTAFYGVRVFELQKSARLHVHTVQNGFVGWDVLNQCRWNTIIGMVKQLPVWSYAIGGYLDKELKKQFKNGDDGIGRRWATFGKFNAVRLRDVQSEGPDVDALRYAFTAREKGERVWVTMERADAIFTKYVRDNSFNMLEGGEEDDRYESDERAGIASDVGGDAEWSWGHAV